MKKALFYFAVFAIFVFILSSCADAQQVQKCVTGHTYGFWGGLWHGIIAPFAFFGSLIDSDIAIYAINNNGGFYNLGFLMGIGALSISIFKGKSMIIISFEDDDEDEKCSGGCEGKCNHDCNNGQCCGKCNHKEKTNDDKKDDFYIVK